ncbi:MAG: HD domain-containing protein [Coriobacteriia bacterium]|nr:HD domain-containing protein [Coriobacteriia bacterium]
MTQEVLDLHGVRLAEAGLGLMACHTDEDVFDVAREFLGELVPDAIVIVSKSAGDQTQMVARDVLGISKRDLAVASKLIGFDVIGRVSPIDPKMLGRFATRRLVRMPGGLSEFAAVELHPALAEMVTMAFGIEGVYTIGIADETVIYGSLTFLTKRNGQLLPAPVIESLVYQCFLTLAHKETERALRQSEEKFRVLTESMKDVVWTLDPQTQRFLYMSPSVFGLRGFTAEEVVAQPLMEFMTPEAYKLVLTTFVQDLGHDPTPDELRTGFDTRELQLPCKDGSLIWVEITSHYHVNQQTGRVEVLGLTRDISERKRADAALLDSNARLEVMVYAVAEAMGRAVELRDPYTQGHEVRVAKLARSLAEEMGLPAVEADGVEMAALVHDIGKLSVPAEILNKPGILSPHEFGLIKRHPRAGYEILKDIDFPWPVAEAVLHHHERMDGSGYPDALAGDEISTMSRILGVADVIEAMASDRPYRAALGLDVAMAEIAERPALYDPAVTAACFRLHASGGIAW